MTRFMILSSDCHAGALPATYNDYMPAKYHDAANDWWIRYAREMILRKGTFFDQEAVEAYDEKAGGETGKFGAARVSPDALTDDVLRDLLTDGESAFAPRRGEWDPSVRLEELEADGVAGEVVFPQMVPFGASLLQFRGDDHPELNHVGNHAYNRWLADFCNAHPGRHAGVAIISVDDIDLAVKEIRDARDNGLFGGVLLPGTTGRQPFYHHPRYEPIWAVCEELDMPLQSHSSWSPDYGDVDCATAMYISEVDMFAHRPFTALLWSGAFERHPGLKLVLTETGCSWILETLRVLEFKSADPIFKHFTKDLSLSPSEYFARQCFIGASFMPSHEGPDRHRIGLDKLMWGSDYPHLEGTWPNTMAALHETMGEYPEDEIAALLGENASKVYDFDVERLRPIGDRIGPSLDQIRSGPR
jgi:predicted TIM-barrel fold metal-dependent hydrolase